MPPRRGRGRKNITPVKKEEEGTAENLNESIESGTDVEMAEDAPENAGGEEAGEPMEQDVKAEATTNGDSTETKEDKPSEDDVKYPYQIRVGPMPSIYSKEDFSKYLASTFKVMVPKILGKHQSPSVLLCFADKEQQENLLRVLDGHVWRKKALRATSWLPLENRKRKLEDGDNDPEQKKNKMDEDVVEERKLTLEEEIVSESLPLLNVPYPEQKKKGRKEEKPWMTDEIRDLLEQSQTAYRAWKADQENTEKKEVYRNLRNVCNKLLKVVKFVYSWDSWWLLDLESLAAMERGENRLSRQDVELMSTRLHGLYCSKNKALAGWAEKSCDDYGGTLFKVEPLKTCPWIQGYRTKCKFRIGKNADEEITVGFFLSDHKSKILEVAPGDRLIHLPDNMKSAAKAFKAFLKESGKEAYDKKSKTGVWDNLLVRVAPNGGIMLVVVFGPKALDEAALTKVKADLVTFYTTGEGKDSNVFSIFLQEANDSNSTTASSFSPEKLHHVWGETSYEENICGLKFHVSPFSIPNINPASSENIYSSVLELAELTPETIVIDACAGSGGIAFVCSRYCEKVYAIEPQEDNISDAEKTKELNSITNVEIVKGKCEDHLDKVLAKDDVKDKDIVIILDPPRHGVMPKVIGFIRGCPNVKKVIYVCSNTKTGVRNFLDIAAAEVKEFNVHMAGLPFLPTRAIPIDIAPFTVNNTVPVLLERIDPSTYPAPTKPIPEPPRKEQFKKRQHSAGRRRGGGPRGGMRGVRSGGVRGSRSGPRFNVPPFMRPPLMGRGMQSRDPQRNRPAGRYSDNLISKYERRIAELEEQDRAFKAGLSMGLQALNRGGGMSGLSMGTSPRNMGDYSTGEAFGGYRGGYKDPYGDNSGSWVQGSSSGYGGSAGGGYGSGSGYSAGAGYGGSFAQDTFNGGSGYGGGYTDRSASLSNSRFVGVGNRSGGGNRGYGGGNRGGNRNQRGGNRGGGRNRR